MKYYSIAEIPYPIDFRSWKIPHRLGPFDVTGIPMADYGRNGGVIYNPVTVAQFALAQHQLFIDKHKKINNSEFLKCANWFVRECKEEKKKRFCTWYYSIDLPALNAKAPWISAMAQGQAISVLLRAYDITKNKLFIDTAEYASNGFMYHVDDGGLYSIENDKYFYEEVAVNRPAHILNGCMFAIIGLYEYADAFRKKNVEKLLWRGVDGLMSLSDRFDTGYWSLYCLYPKWNVASRSYHNLHVKQFQYLGKILNINKYLQLANRWNEYQNQRIKLIRYRSMDYMYRYMNLWRRVTNDN